MNSTENTIEAAREKLIVALDVESLEAARKLIVTLRGVVKWFKIGSQLFTRAGENAVREVQANDARVFLDLKFHDIPHTVARSCREAVRMNVKMFNVHALGGREMMRQAVEATRAAAQEFAVEIPQLIAVTLLTSHDEATLREIGLRDSLHDQSARLARLAADAGLNGVVASAQEVNLIRRALARQNFVIVTPGVRPSASPRDDQKRVLTPREAVVAGADFLVMGRAIINADDVAHAAHAALQEIAEGLKGIGN